MSKRQRIRFIREFVLALVFIAVSRPLSDVGWKLSSSLMALTGMILLVLAVNVLHRASLSVTIARRPNDPTPFEQDFWSMKIIRVSKPDLHVSRFRAVIAWVCATMLIFALRWWFADFQYTVVFITIALYIAAAMTVFTLIAWAVTQIIFVRHNRIRRPLFEKKEQ